MQAATLQERVPEFGYRYAFEEESQADVRHVVNDDEQISEDGVSEGYVWVEVEMEE